MKAVTLSNLIQANLISISKAMSTPLARVGKASLEFAPQQLNNFKRSHAASQLNRQLKAGKASQQLAADVSKPVMRGLMGDIWNDITSHWSEDYASGSEYGSAAGQVIGGAAGTMAGGAAALRGGAV